MAWIWCGALLLLLVALAGTIEAQIKIRSEDGIAVVMPLEHVSLNYSSFHRLRRRELLGSARMKLHDDLLTKGYYTSRVMIGTPPHEFALIVDTGSTVTYVPCSSCKHCGHHQDPRFSPDSSSSYKQLGCGNECNTGFCDGTRCSYRRQYAEMSSSSGVLGKDLFLFSNISDLGNQQLIFGCETEEKGDLYYQTADGIMGLGRGPLSIVDQLVEQKAMDNVFSLCYGGMDEGGGAMILGSFTPPPEMAFTYSDPHRSPYYNLVLNEIRVAGKPLDLKPEVFNGKYGTVLDSGTTYAYFPEAAFDHFKNAVKQQVGSLQEVAGPDPNFKDICYAGAGTNTSKLSQFFPSVDFVFGDGASVTLTPENYLFRHTKTSGAYCLGVFKNGDPTTLLGGIVVRNMLVTYNREKEKIGFYKTNCNNLWKTLRDSSSENTDFGHSTQPHQFMFPPSPSPSPLLGPISNSRAIEISMLLGTNYSTFSRLTNEFKIDVARQLGVKLEQVSIVNFTASGAVLRVNWMVFPAAGVDDDEMERIISRLEHHEVELSEVFGVYNLTSWRVVSVPNAPKQRGAEPSVITITVIGTLIILLVCAAGIVVYWQLQRFRSKEKHSYQVIEQQSATSVEQEGGVQLQQL